MKRFLLILGLVSSFGFAQKSKKEILGNPNNNCIRISTISFDKIAKKFPFSQSTKIKLVSFEFKIPQSDKNSDTGAIEEEIGNQKLPTENGKLKLTKIKESVDLKFNDVIELTDILFNYSFNPKKKGESVTMSCYEPRNAIVFLNDKDEIIEYIEICFTCLNHDIFKKSNFGFFCMGKYDLIKSFFIQKGINYGPNFK